MGIASEYRDADDLLVVVWHGLVSGGEWAQFVRQRLADDPGWPNGKRRLADLTTLDPSLLSSTDVENVIPLYSARLRNLAGTRQAIVATHGWDLARDFERRIDRLGATTVVFNRVSDACEWLGIDEVAVSEVITRLRAALRDA
jgi:hypothetical protein